jgi:4-hydroxy-3-polyprenylbenzoate decarboxylase
MGLRMFISELDTCNELTHIKKEVDWKYEIGEITRQYKNKAILFENIKDYKDNYLFTGAFSNLNTIKILLGMDKKSKRKDIVTEIRSRFSVQGNISINNNVRNEYEADEGDHVNLYNLPVPWWHAEDGGRYVGTWHINVSKDPFTNRINAGVYRMQILSKNTTSISVSKGSHLADHVKKHTILKRDSPVAVAIGVDERIVMAAAASFEKGIDEYYKAASLMKKELVLQKCKRSDLEVPLDSEIILEGNIKRGVCVTDGPFFDYCGKKNVNEGALLFEVNVIRKRKKPYFRGTAVGCPGAEDHNLLSLLASIDLVNFHGNTYRQMIQNYFLRHKMFQLFQLTGRIHS